MTAALQLQLAKAKKAISKEVARQQVVLDIPEVFEQSATSSGGGAQFGVADHQSEPNIDAQEDDKNWTLVSR